MEKAEVEGRILIRLYEAFFKGGESYNLHLIREEVRLDDDTFWRIADYLSREGLIKASGMGGFYRITSPGIVRAERENLADEELRASNDRTRTVALDTLADLYEEAPYRDVHIEILAAKTGADARALALNLMVLQDLGYVESSGTACYELTNRGLDAVEDLRQRRGLVEEFDRITALSPQPRGRALQKLFAKAVGKCGWLQEEGARTSHEEMDVVVHKDREYYLVECKWEQDPIEAGVVRELFGKLGNRVGVQGIVVSMSGFTGGAVEQAHDFASSRIVLFFGPNDVQAVIHRPASFDKMLDDKYHELVTRRKVVWD